MKNKHLLFIVLVLAVGVVISSRSSSAIFNEEENGDEDNIVSVYDPKKEDVHLLHLEEYVVGVVAAEMPASFKEEAIKAQAVAARTYAKYKMEHTNREYDLIADVSNQAYITVDEMKEKWGNDFEKYYNKIKECVFETKDEIMTYDGKTIIAYYFAMSNGKTEDVQSVFGEKSDYLKSVDSSWDKSLNNFKVTNTFSRKDFCEKLDIFCDNLVIGDVKKTASGRVETIVINGKTFKGTRFRQLLGIRSTDFDIDLQSNVLITTRGYGHGVGMSQYGANAMAKEGKSYEEILKYYYQNINLSKVSV